MPSCTKAKNPRGIEIIFTEEPHEYYSLLPLSTGIVSPTGAIWRGDEKSRSVDNFIRASYTSGTTFVHKFCPPFDPDGKIALRAAQKKGVSVDQIKFEWKQRSAEACEMGTRVHATCEDFFYDRPCRFQPQSEKERRIMQAGITAAQAFKSKYRIMGVEQLVGDLDCQLAGSIDLLAYDPATDTWWILDWKTNAKIEKDNTFKTGQFMKDPIAHLKNCNFVHYALQLNTYKYLLYAAAYVPRMAKIRCGIIHLTEAGPIFYEMPDYSNEVRDMLIYILEQPPF